MSANGYLTDAELSPIAGGIGTSSEDAAWLAGWLEGEGCFHDRRNARGHLRLLVEAASTDRDVIERAARIAGAGHVRLKRSVGKPLWNWRVEARADAVRVLRLIRPYMGLRRGARIDEMLALEMNEPDRTPTTEDRRKAASKMWVTRRRRYGVKGSR
jgi:hypothetical protein